MYLSMAGCINGTYMEIHESINVCTVERTLKFVNYCTGKRKYFRAVQFPCTELEKALCMLGKLLRENVD